jgi:hypothetical protein
MEEEDVEMFDAEKEGEGEDGKDNSKNWFFDGQDYYLILSCTCGKPISHFQRPLERCVLVRFEELKRSKLRNETKLSWRIIEDKANDEGRRKYIQTLERIGEIERLCCKKMLLGLPIPMNIPRVIEDSDDEEGSDDEDGEFLLKSHSYPIRRA